MRFPLIISCSPNYYRVKQKAPIGLARTLQNFSNFPVAFLPAAYRTAFSGAGQPTTVNRIQLRMEEAGNRTNEVTSDAQRIVLGATGSVDGWDYDAAFMRAENRATDKYVDGYVLFDKFDAAVRELPLSRPTTTRLR